MVWQRLLQSYGPAVWNKELGGPGRKNRLPRPTVEKLARRSDGAIVQPAARTRSTDSHRIDFHIGNTTIRYMLYSVYSTLLDLVLSWLAGISARYMGVRPC